MQARLCFKRVKKSEAKMGNLRDEDEGKSLLKKGEEVSKSEVRGERQAHAVLRPNESFCPFNSDTQTLVSKSQIAVQLESDMSPAPAISQYHVGPFPPSQRLISPSHMPPLLHATNSTSQDLKRLSPFTCLTSKINKQIIFFFPTPNRTTPCSSPKLPFLAQKSSNIVDASPIIGPYPFLLPNGLSSMNLKDKVPIEVMSIDKQTKRPIKKKKFILLKDFIMS